MKRILTPLMLLIFTLGGNAVAQQATSFPEIPVYVLPPDASDRTSGEDPMGVRLFRTTTTRPQIQLSGFWDFSLDPRGEGEKLGWPERPPKPETSLWIPGTWNSSPRYWQYEGTAWLTRTFQMPVDGDLRLRFGGVFYRCKVWLDGVLLGGHEGGYSPFALHANRVPKGSHRLVVMADNKLNENTLPKDGVDWFPYGGIYRSVIAEIVPAVFVDNFHIVPTELQADRAKLAVRAYLKNRSDRSVEEQIQFDVDGTSVYAKTASVQPGDSRLDFEIVIPRPKLWSPDVPHLYFGRLALKSSNDDQFTRFGLRKFELAGPRVLLNGMPFKVMGANHHDDHPDWGSALPPSIIRQDIEIIKRMGANAVRGHYPPDEMFLDFCDQSGLIFMNEIPAWQYSYDQLASPVVQEKIKRQFKEMVDRDMNHPAIFSWSLGNEWPEFERSYDVLKSLVEYARSVDSTHFITYVTGGAHFGRSSGLLDIICTNWAQYQWYDPFTFLSVEEGENSIVVLNKIHEAYPDKPVILTEFGGAESQAGWHNWGNVKWSEEYQARNVEDSGRYALDTPWIAGGCVWQFCVTRSAPSRFLAGRLRGWNSKGVVDEYRAPKMAFYKLQELYRGRRKAAGSQLSSASR